MLQSIKDDFTIAPSSFECEVNQKIEETFTLQLDESAVPNVKNVYIDLSKFGGDAFTEMNYVGSGGYTLTTTLNPQQSGDYNIPLLYETNTDFDGNGIYYLIGIDVHVIDCQSLSIHNDDISLLGSNIDLLKTFPNPFFSKIKISYKLNISSYVRVSIYNIVGECIINLINEKQDEGLHYIEWDGKNMNGENIANGFYLIEIIGENNEVQSRILKIE